MTTTAVHEFGKNIEDAVVRSLWEPRHEWESRVKFVEDHVADYGVEKAVNLSLIWANMKFLECSYPPETEAKVVNYPIPSPDQLRAIRKRTNQTTAERSDESSKRPKLSFAEVSALLSSVHTQSSIKATPLQIQSIANEMCLCKDCLELTEDANYSDKGSKILKSYENTHQDFNFEITKEVEKQNEVWSLVLNGDIVLKRKGDQSVLLEDFVKIMNNWQEANQKPSCLSMVDNQQSDSGYHQEGAKFDSNQWSHSNPSHYSYSSSPNAGYEDPQQGYRPRHGAGDGYRDSRNWGHGQRGRGYGHNQYNY